MSDHCRDIQRSKTTSSAFLLSRSEPCGPSPEYGPGSDEAAAWMIETLSGAFAEVVPPGRLIEKASFELAAETRFAAMVIRFDELGLSSGPEAVVVDTAAVLDKFCREKGGFWGIFDADILACFITGKDSSACTEIAQAVSSKLAEQRNDTVTAGITEYPLLEYRCEEILENARKALEHAEFFGPGSLVVFDSVSLNISGDKYYQAGDIDTAIAEFKKALAFDPENINVLNSLGVCHGVREAYKEALECFTKAMELDPEEVMAVYNSGYVHLCLGNYEKALELFLLAGQIDENLFEAAFQAGRIYMETGRPGHARKFLENAVNLNKGSGAAFRYLGDCYLAVDRDEDAAAAYKTALKLRPDDAEALSALGFLYEMQNRNADIALMFCRRAVEMYPDNPVFHHRLGRVSYNRGLHEQALGEFEAAIELGHVDSEEYVELLRGTGGIKESVK